MNRNQKEYSVTLINPKTQTKRTIKVASDEVILDKAKQQGIDLPACCCAAACTVCTGKVLEGNVEQTAQAIQFLGYPVVDAGYVLTRANASKMRAELSYNVFKISNYQVI